MATTNGTDITEYDYDAFGNLRSVVLPDSTEIEYVIDARQRRVGKKIDGDLVQGFLYWNQLKPIAELDGAGNVVSTFVYGRNPDVPEYMVKGGVTYRLVTDHVGSVRLVVKTQDGTVAQRIDYDEWGRVLQDTNPGFQPFGFAGGLYDADTRLVRLGYRDYDPEVRRWTARDPILFAGGQANLYVYCHGDPVNWVDPWGLEEEKTWEEEKEEIILLAAVWAENSPDWGLFYQCGQQAQALRDFLKAMGPWEHWDFDIMSGYSGNQLFPGTAVPLSWNSESHNVVQATPQSPDPDQKPFTLDAYNNPGKGINPVPRKVSIGTPETFKKDYPKQ